MYTCIAADCGDPTFGNNLELMYNSTLEGSVVFIDCEEFTLTSVCLHDGTWNPNPGDKNICDDSTTNSGIHNNY